ncbi:hypothetical protein AXE65_05850 [Ventosimonas gracilis]|uniref:diphosphoinositol-polyphosphate diphosphatase n=1 Tax=Ventosimonas gracilis TaxID=1680762 RepID=A0A139SMK4_9GAMM|nr:dual specificity protein phosphatase family protein [Ventosimonas gracilis]KXU35700.1 hypothetical protein AXE65_05850 [Ventosimonas gracilis]
MSYLLPAKWHWLVLLLAALSCSAHADQAPRPPHWSVPIDNRLNLHQVDAKLYRSALPDTEAVDPLKALGIVSVVNFYQESDARWIGNADLQEIHLPLRTRWFDDEDALDALRSLRGAQEKGPVLIHCKHGQNRTGLVVALYRMVYQGWSKAEALAEMRSFGGSEKRMEHAEDYLEDVDIDELKQALVSGACSTSALDWCHVEDWWERLASAD